jgi:hypothetical protein
MSVAIALGTGWLAQYSLANAPIIVALGILALPVRIFTPIFWRLIASNPRRAIAFGDHMTSLLILGAAALATIGQALYPWFIHTFLPRYVASIPVFEILALEIPFFVAAQVPAVMLNSERVDRRVIPVVIISIALVANTAANAVALALHGGVIAVACDDVAIQALAAAAVFVVARPQQGNFIGRMRELRGGLVGFAVAGSAGALMLSRILGNIPESGSTGTLMNNVTVLLAAWAVAACVLAVTRTHSPLRSS